MTPDERLLDVSTVDPAPMHALAARLDAGFNEAAGKTQHVRRSVDLAGNRIDVCIASEALAARLLPAWEPLPDAPPTRPCDLSVCAWTSEPSGVSAPPAPFELRERWWRGVVADTPEFAGQLQGPIRILSLLDRRAARGHWWMPDLGDVPGWESAAPFRTLLHWWAPSRGLQLAHAAAVGLAGEGVLLVGKGGVGKSTTALSCLAAGMSFVGDDYVFTSLAHERVRAFPAYGTAKMEPERLGAWFPDLAALGTDRVEAGGKAIVPIPRTSLVSSLEIRALILPTLSNATVPRWEAASPRSAMLSLAPSTLFQLPCSGKGAMDHLAAIVRRLPTFRLHLGPDPVQNADAIAACVRSGGHVDAR